MYCQKCRSPLKVDSSLDQLNPAAFNLLVGSTGASLEQQTKISNPLRPLYPPERKELYDQASQNAQSPVFKRHIPAPRHATSNGAPSSPSRAGLKDNPAMSFVMLSESQLVPQNSIEEKKPDDARSKSQDKAQTNKDRRADGDEKLTLSHQMETTTRLFEILSARSDIDHPICVECTELLVEGLQKRLRRATKERDAYVEFLKRINAEVPTEDERQKAEEELKQAEKEEATAFAELQQLEREKAAVDEEIATLDEEARQLDGDEEQFWRDRNAFALTLTEFQNERDAVNLQYDHDSRLLERLQRTNVYNDTFCIGHDGYFGTINGLRLGRLPNQAVEWAEINAAWGQTLLLLATVAEKLSFTFDAYRLKPMGSTSKIEKLELSPTASSTTTGPSPTETPSTSSKVSVLELYSSGDLPLGRMFLHRRFDAAMVAFLECLRQLGEFVEHDPGRPAGGRPREASPSSRSSPSEAGLKLPYDIRKDRIGDASIKLGFNQDEAWTRACKYTLTCCKFLLAHASNVRGAGRKGGGGGGGGG